MKYIVGNWKMNQDLEAIKKFFVALDKVKMDFHCHTWVAPQFVHIPILKDLAFTLGKVKVGAQNCSEFENGAYTGDVSASTLEDLGVHFVILGHSERRAIFKETNQTLAKKLSLALKANLQVIFCVGETLQEREDNLTWQVVKKQLDEGLKDMPSTSLDSLIIAYEPVWAIGTGKNATSDEAQEVHALIRKWLSERFAGKTAPILYGGSVKPSNINELLMKPDIDGALVGGASLKGEDFAQLITTASQFR